MGTEHWSICECETAILNLFIVLPNEIDPKSKRSPQIESKREQTANTIGHKVQKFCNIHHSIVLIWCPLHSRPNSGFKSIRLAIHATHTAYPKSSLLKKRTILDVEPIFRFLIILMLSRFAKSYARTSTLDQFKTKRVFACERSWTGCNCTFRTN